MPAYVVRMIDWSSDVCSSELNALKDMMRAVDATPSTGNSCGIHSSGWQDPTNPYYPTDATADYLAPIGSMGHPRDKCHAVRDGDRAEERRVGKEGVSTCQ